MKDAEEKEDDKFINYFSHLSLLPLRFSHLFFLFIFSLDAGNGVQAAKQRRGRGYTKVVQCLSKWVWSCYVFRSMRRVHVKIFYIYLSKIDIVNKIMSPRLNCFQSFTQVDRELAKCIPALGYIQPSKEGDVKCRCGA